MHLVNNTAFTNDFKYRKKDQGVKKNRKHQNEVIILHFNSEF